MNNTETAAVGEAWVMAHNTADIESVITCALNQMGNINANAHDVFLHIGNNIAAGSELSGDDLTLKISPALKISAIKTHLKTNKSGFEDIDDSAAWSDEELLDMFDIEMQKAQRQEDDDPTFSATLAAWREWVLEGQQPPSNV